MMQGNIAWLMVNRKPRVKSSMKERKIDALKRAAMQENKHGTNIPAQPQCDPAMHEQE